MRTPVEFSNELKHGIITSDMLAMVLYSFNKRAKNYRDKEYSYKNSRYMPVEYEEQYHEKKIEMYKAKESLLSFLTPKCIHKVALDKDYITKVYDDEYYDPSIATRIDEGCYFDRETNEEVFFTKVRVKATINCYYLFYKIGNFSFHTPIGQDDLCGTSLTRIDESTLISKYNLLIKNIGDLNTFGKDIKDLLSLQFCHKVLDSLINGTAKLVLT